MPSHFSVLRWVTGLNEKGLSSLEFALNGSTVCFCGDAETMTEGLGQWKPPSSGREVRSGHRCSSWEILILLKYFTTVVSGRYACFTLGQPFSWIKTKTEIYCRESLGNRQYSSFPQSSDFFTFHWPFSCALATFYFLDIFQLQLTFYIILHQFQVNNIVVRQS